MKKHFLYHCLFLFILFPALLFSCSDNDKDTPEPPAEIKDGINLSPDEPKADEQVKITFKASKASALYGYTGDVYAHIGIVEGSDWKYVPAAWDENIAKCKMTKEESNVWSLTLSPDIRTWFAAPAGLMIHKIGIVFRSADGTKKGIETDSFIPVTDDSFSPGKVVFAPQPEGTEEGINVIDPATVTLVFYDKDLNGKRKDYAYVIGDFNDWALDNTYQMKRDEDTGCWWYTLTGLQGGKEYAFQYYVGSESEGAIRLADAYTEKVLDPLDAYIPASTYPGLRSYPADKTSGVVSTFVTEVKMDNEPVFIEIKDRSNLVIYEMLLRDFTESGDINGALAKLDYLEEMGITAIELMPVQEFDGNDSWGYNPCFFFAVDKAYGTKDMYRRFIDECHKRGMAVILDVVYNHATGAHPFAKLYWDAEADKTTPANPWFNVDAPHPYSVFHDFNHESPLVRRFVKRNLQFLLREFEIDGFRFDLTKGFTQNNSTGSNAGNYDASRIAILKDYNAAIREVHPEAIVILEHFAEETEERELAQDGMILWRNVNNAFCQSAMGWPDDSGFNALGTKGTTMPFGAWVGFMESHDEERAAYKQTQWGNYNLKTDLDSRMKQLAVNCALCFAVPGPKMVWQFGELGYDVSIEENGRTGRKPVKWEYYENTSRKELYDVYSLMINLRSGHPELFSSTQNMEWAVGQANWNAGRFVSLRSIEGKGLVVAGNFTNTAVECDVNFQSAGTWYNYIDENDVLELPSENRKIAIPAHSFVVYTNFR